MFHCNVYTVANKIIVVVVVVEVGPKIVVLRYKNVLKYKKQKLWRPPLTREQTL